MEAGIPPSGQCLALNSLAEEALFNEVFRVYGDYSCNWFDESASMVKCLGNQQKIGDVIDKQKLNFGKRLK